MTDPKFDRHLHQLESAYETVRLGVVNDRKIVRYRIGSVDYEERPTETTMKILRMRIQNYKEELNRPKIKWTEKPEDGPLAVVVIILLLLGLISAIMKN